MMMPDTPDARNVAVVVDSPACENKIGAYYGSLAHGNEIYYGLSSHKEQHRSQSTGFGRVRAVCVEN